MLALVLFGVSFNMSTFVQKKLEADRRQPVASTMVASFWERMRSVNYINLIYGVRVA